MTLSHRGGEQAVLLNGEDVSQFLRAQEVGDMASAFSPLAPVREKLLFLQREKPAFSANRTFKAHTSPLQGLQ